MRCLSEEDEDEVGRWPPLAKGCFRWLATEMVQHRDQWAEAHSRRQQRQQEAAGQPEQRGEGSSRHQKGGTPIHNPGAQQTTAK
jgi:hypothetical protein